MSFEAEPGGGPSLSRTAGGPSLSRTAGGPSLSRTAGGLLSMSWPRGRRR